jgi:hypothetical protein
MALDATLSRWRIMTPRSCVSGMLSMVTVTLKGSEGTRKYPQSSREHSGNIQGTTHCDGSLEPAIGVDGHTASGLASYYSGNIQ